MNQPTVGSEYLFGAWEAAMWRNVCFSIGLGLTITATWTSAQAVDTRSRPTLITPGKSSHAAQIGKDTRSRWSKPASMHKSASTVRRVTAHRVGPKFPSASTSSGTGGKVHAVKSLGAGTSISRLSPGKGSSDGKAGLQTTLRDAAAAAKQRHNLVGTGQLPTIGQPAAAPIGNSTVHQPLREPPKPQTGSASASGSLIQPATSDQPGVRTVGATGQAPDRTAGSAADSAFCLQHPAVCHGHVDNPAAGTATASGSSLPSSGSGQPGVFTVGGTGQAPAPNGGVQSPAPPGALIAAGQAPAPALTCPNGAHYSLYGTHWRCVSTESNGTLAGQAGAQGSGRSSTQPGAMTVGETGVAQSPGPATSAPSGALPPLGSAVAPGASTVGNTGVAVPPPTPEPIREKPRNSARSGLAANASMPAPALSGPGALVAGKTGMLTPPPGAAFDPVTDTPQPLPSPTPTNLPAGLEGLSGIMDQTGFQSPVHAGVNNPNVGYQCIIRFRNRDYPEPGHGLPCIAFCLNPKGHIPGDRTGYLDATTGLQCVRDFTKTCDLRAPHNEANWTDDKGAGSFQVDGIGQYPSGDSYGYYCVGDPRVTDLPPAGDPNRGVMCAVNDHGDCDLYFYDQPCNMAEAADTKFRIPTTSGNDVMYCVPNPVCSYANAYPELVGSLSFAGGPRTWMKFWAGQCGRASVCTDAMFNAINKLGSSAYLNDFAKVCKQSLPPAMTLDQYCSLPLSGIGGLNSLQKSACDIAQKMALSDFCSLSSGSGSAIELAQREVCESPAGGWN